MTKTLCSLSQTYDDIIKFSGLQRIFTRATCVLYIVFPRRPAPAPALNALDQSNLVHTESSNSIDISLQH